MDEALPFKDIVQLYQGTLLLRKGRLVKILAVNGDLSVDIFDLKAQRTINVLFVQDEYKTPSKRIGFVNIQQNAYYVIRMPVRVYAVGFHADNIEIRTIQGLIGANNYAENRRVVSDLRSKAILAAYSNIYPSFEEACTVAAQGGSCAFDKQFAVSNTGQIYYKTRLVGKTVDNQPCFDKDFQYLSTLLGGQHEKTSRTFGPTSL